MKESAKGQLTSVVSSIHELEKSKDEYTAEQIISYTTNTSYNVTKLEEGSNEFNEYKLDIDIDGDIVITEGIIPNAKIYTKIYDDYYCIDNFSNNNLTWIVNLIIIIALVACILIGTLITGFVSRTILQPIRDLNQATAEISRGNFNVKVHVPDDYEYSSLVRNFNKMATELAGTETLRGDFISNVSHEFKTPLASIQGFTRLLQDTSISPEEREEYTNIIIEETGRLSKLTSNILRLTKLEHQSTIGKKARFSLDEQIRKIILVLEREWSKKNINLNIELDSVNYYGNEELMAQIWQNIINNAIKFTPKDGNIIVQLFRTEQSITCRVSNEGNSIPAEVMAHIFDKFYQGDKSRATEGNGLGLALVKRVVDLCSGSVYVENLLDGGVCFTVELPYAISDMQ